MSKKNHLHRVRESLLNVPDYKEEEKVKKNGVIDLLG